MGRDETSARELIERHFHETVAERRRVLFEQTMPLLARRSTSDGLRLSCDLLAHTAYVTDPERFDENRAWADDFQASLIDGCDYVVR